MSAKIFEFFRRDAFLTIIGVFFILLGLFLFLALLTFHPLDPSFNTAFDNVVSNKAGRIGAFVANPILQSFGMSSFLLCVFLLNWGIIYFMQHQNNYFFLRFVAVIFAMISLSSILAFFDTSSSWEFISYGGLIGYYLFFGVSNSVPVFIYFIFTVLSFLFFVAFAFTFDRTQRVFFCFGNFLYVLLYHLKNYIFNIVIFLFQNLMSFCFRFKSA